jgi:hypothetical protein
MSNAVSIAQGGSNNVTMRNRIINGAMNVNQYNSGASFTPTSGSYIVDRFQYQGSQSGKFTAQQLSASPPPNFGNYMGMTVASPVTVGSGDYFLLRQNIEGFSTYDFGFGTSSAKALTLSFWVYSSLTGSFGASIENYAENRSIPLSYTISVANTWTYITIPIPADTSGTWVGATNAGSMRLNISLGVGSSYSGTAGSWTNAPTFQPTGSVSVVATSGAVFYITGVQVEAGTTATPFEYRQYGTELALCQRYCLNVNSANCNGSYNRYAYGECNSTTQISADVFFPVQMRTYPSLTTPAANQFCIYTKVTINAGSAIAIGPDGTNINAACVNVTTSGTVVQGNAGAIMSNSNNTSYLLFTAEL